MKDEGFSDAVLIVIRENNTFSHHHLKDPSKKIFVTKDGIKLNIDLSKAYHLHGWVPWVDWSWWSPWSIVKEWLWKVDHRVALLIYDGMNLNENPGPLDAIGSFDDKGNPLNMTPRGLEGFTESRIPVNYFKKWTTGGGKIAWWVWGLLIVVIVIAFYIFVLRGP